MNKQEVIRLSAKLDEIFDKDELSFDESTFRLCSKLTHELWLELHTKPVMPKVFDEWAKNFSLDTKDGLEEALWVLMDIYYNSGTDSGLDEWIHLDGTDEKKYSRCVDAVVNGYEVEK